MSGPDDHLHEMSTHTLTDEAVEAFFSGRSHPGWEREESLAMLADDVALAVSGPAPRPDHALLQLFWSTPAPRPGPEARGAMAPGGRLRMAAGALLASIMAFTGVGVAGAVGALPAPVERIVNRVVETVTPFELTEPGADGSNGRQGGQPSHGQGGAPPAPVPVPVAPSPQAPGTGPAPTSVPAAPGAPVPTGADRAPQPPAGATPGPTPGAAGQPPAAAQERAGQAPVAPWTAPSAPRSPGPPPGRP